MTEDPEIPQLTNPAGDPSPDASLPEKTLPDSTPTQVTPGRNLLEEEPEPSMRTGNLFSRITGSLRRTTGSLQDPEARHTGDLPSGLTGELADTPQPYPPERRKSVTGQLGSIITGILRGSPAECGPAKSSRRPRPRPEADEYVSELRQNLATEENIPPQPKGRTGSLIGNLTGSLFRFTGSLGRSEQPPQLNNTGEIQLPGTIPPLEYGEAENDQDILPGQPGASPAAEPPAWAEPEDIVIELGPSEPLDVELARPAGETPSMEDLPGIQLPVSAPVETTPPSQKLPGEDLGQVRRTGSMLRRITGPLNRNTGSLQDPEANPPDAGSEGLDQPETAHEPYPPERRKSVTGQLGALIAGILRGAPDESEAPKPPRRIYPRPEVDEYVSELRQDLTIEEPEPPKRKSRTGSLITAITGSLRRATGPMGGTGQLFGRKKTDKIDQPEDNPPLAPIQAEIEQDILAGRLSTTSIAEPPAWVEPEDFVIELGPGEGLEEELPAPAGLPETEEPFAGLPESVLREEGEAPSTEIDSISLLESGAIAALDQAENQARQVESEQDWMSEIRQEASEQESAGESGPDAEKRKSAADQLRSFISGFMRRPEEQEVGSVQPDDQIVELGEGQGEVSDDLVSGRLDRSLGIAGEEEPPLDYLPGFLIGAAAAAQPGEDQVDEESLLQSLASRFDQVSDHEAEAAEQPFISFEETAQPADETGLPYGSFTFEQAEPDDMLKTDEPYVPFVPVQPEDQPEPLTLTPEDELLIWGDSGLEGLEEGRTIRAEDFWEDAQVRHETDTGPMRVSAQDAYAAEFLTGEQVIPEIESTGTDTLLQQIYEQYPGKRQAPFEDIRSIALEDVPDEEWPRPAEVVEASPDLVEAAEAPAAVAGVAVHEPEVDLTVVPARNWKTWFASLPWMRKILLVEGVVVVIALLVTVPFYLAMMLRGPDQANPPISFLVPRALPDNLPYPTGLTLPGGWSFDLKKSTFVEGKWQPAGGEWLEGTELRRVVALPWNPQTQAVVQSFQPGDVIELKLNNERSIPYKVTKVERIPVGETTILSDLKPSLAIILYQEDSDERWVVLSQR